MTEGDDRFVLTAPPVVGKETLARAVTSGSEARLARNHDGKIGASTFTHYDRRKLSVDRIDCMMEDEAVDRGVAVAVERGPNRRFHGWALIEASEVMNLGLEAIATPQEAHRWHADIVLPEEAATDQAAHNRYAAALARRAEWRASPA